MNKMIIGENAGKVWRFLSNNAGHKYEFHEMSQTLGLTVPGWLAREDKVEIEFVQKDGTSEIAYIYLTLNVYF